MVNDGLECVPHASPSHPVEDWSGSLSRPTEADADWLRWLHYAAMGE
jgi:hypothetical protein